METMLDEIAQEGLIDPSWHEVLDALREGRANLPTLFTKYRKYGLDGLKESLHNPLLKDVCKEYLRVDDQGKVKLGLEKLLYYAPPNARLRWLRSGRNIQFALLDAEDDGLKRNSVCRTMKVAASKLCRYAFGDKVRDEIFKEVHFTEEKDERTVHLSADQFEDLLKAAKDDPEIQAMIAIAGYTGADRRPLLRLRVRDVTFVTKGDTYAIIYLDDRKTAHRSRSVALVPRVATMLKTLCEGKELDEHIFTVPEGSFYFKYDPIRKAAGLEEVWFKDLRHTYASWADEAGLGLRKTSVSMGHGDMKTTTRYMKKSVVLSIEDALRVAAVAERKAQLRKAGS